MHNHSTARARSLMCRGRAHAHRSVATTRYEREHKLREAFQRNGSSASKSPPKPLVTQLRVRARAHRSVPSQGYEREQEPTEAVIEGNQSRTIWNILALYHVLSDYVV